MPCYTMRKTTVAFGKKTNHMLLAKALSELFGGANVIDYADYLSVASGGASYNKRTGRLTLMQAYGVTEEQVRANYAKHVLIHNAQRAGWVLTKTAQTASTVAERRY